MRGRSSLAVWSAMGCARVGVSFTLATVTSKLSLTLKPAASVAVTLRLTGPTSAFSGVPLKVRVAASKLSHCGNAEPSLWLALSVSTSASLSAKVLAGSWKEKAASSFVVWSGDGLVEGGNVVSIDNVQSKRNVGGGARIVGSGESYIYLFQLPHFLL